MNYLNIKQVMNELEKNRISPFAQISDVSRAVVENKPHQNKHKRICLAIKEHEDWNIYIAIKIQIPKKKKAVIMQRKGYWKGNAPTNRACRARKWHCKDRSCD